jgi:hypothetical protein
MIIKLNNFVINDRESRFYLDTVKGFAIPEIRTSSAVLTERDGGYVASQFYGMRKVSIQGRIFGEDEAELEEKRKEIMAAVRQRSIAIELITNAGNSYLVNGHLTDSEMDFDRLINSSLSFCVLTLLSTTTQTAQRYPSKLASSVAVVTYSRMSYLLNGSLVAARLQRATTAIPQSSL